jgi:hypothetical protein
MTRTRNPLKAELRRLLKKYPDTAFMDVLAPDALGILRGKRIRSGDFDKACDETFWSSRRRQPGKAQVLVSRYPME